MSEKEINDLLNSIIQGIQNQMLILPNTIQKMEGLQLAANIVNTAKKSATTEFAQKRKQNKENHMSPKENEISMSEQEVLQLLDRILNGIQNQMPGLSEDDQKLDGLRLAACTVIAAKNSVMAEFAHKKDKQETEKNGNNNHL